MLAGIKMSHSSTTALCRAMKLQCELYPSRHVALCLDPYCGLGFALWCLSSVYSGHHTILIPPSEVEANPALWLTAGELKVFGIKRLALVLNKDGRLITIPGWGNRFK